MGFFKFKKDREGYSISPKRKNGERKVHRLVALKKYGSIPKGFHVHHVDKNKNNNHPDNLILLHPLDHKNVHGGGKLVIEIKSKHSKTIPQGEKRSIDFYKTPEVPNSHNPWTYDEQQRFEEELEKKTSISEIAKMFGRSESAIRARIKHLENGEI